MAKAIPSCNKGAFAHLPTGRLYLSSYLYIASIDLLQWVPVARRLVLWGHLVYLGLFLAGCIHIYMSMHSPTATFLAEYASAA